MGATLKRRDGAGLGVAGLEADSKGIETLLIGTPFTRVFRAPSSGCVRQACCDKRQKPEQKAWAQERQIRLHSAERDHARGRQFYQFTRDPAGSALPVHPDRAHRSGSAYHPSSSSAT